MPCSGPTGQQGFCFCTGIIFKTSLLREDPRGKKIDNLRFLDGQGEETDLLQVLHLHISDQAALLGDGIHSLPSALPPRAQPPGPRLAGIPPLTTTALWLPTPSFLPISRPCCSSSNICHLVSSRQRRPHWFIFKNDCKVPFATFVPLMCSSKWCNTHTY